MRLRARKQIRRGAALVEAAVLLLVFVTLILGMIVGVIRTTPIRWLRLLGDAWVELFRNVPLLVQMFLWFFVFPELLPASAGAWLKQLPRSNFYTAVLCLGLYTSARVAEQTRAGIQSLAGGQRMAGIALGLTLPQTYRFVLLPMAVLIVMPPLKLPAVTQFIDGTGPVFAGSLFPFAFITIACGAVSGFHALVSSGTTPKMLRVETDARLVGYGSMLTESLVGIMAMIAAATLDPGVYFAMNVGPATLGTTSAAAAQTIAPITAGPEAATCQNASAASQGRKSGTISARLKTVKFRSRLRSVLPTAAQVSPLKRPSRGVR